MHQTLQLNFMKQFGIELTEIRYAKKICKKCFAIDIIYRKFQIKIIKNMNLVIVNKIIKNIFTKIEKKSFRMEKVKIGDFSNRILTYI